MAKNPIDEFAGMFKAITGVEMEHAIDMELAGKHEELLIEVSTAIRKELRPEMFDGSVIDKAVEQVVLAEENSKFRN